MARSEWVTVRRDTLETVLKGLHQSGHVARAALLEDEIRRADHQVQAEQAIEDGAGQANGLASDAERRQHGG